MFFSELSFFNLNDGHPPRNLGFTFQFLKIVQTDWIRDYVYSAFIRHISTTYCHILFLHGFRYKKSNFRRLKPRWPVSTIQMTLYGCIPSSLLILNYSLFYFNILVSMMAGSIQETTLGNTPSEKGKWYHPTVHFQ